MTYKEDNPGGNDTLILCGSSPCQVEVDQNSHRINLIVSRNDAVYAEDSVYVPATKEGEFYCYIYLHFQRLITIDFV